MSTFREKVEATKAYIGLTGVQQKIHGSRKNLITIENGYNVATNIGYDKWVTDFIPGLVSRNIVKELIDNDKTK